MRNHHLFKFINTNRKTKIFQNEKSYSTRHRAGPESWTPDSWTPRSNWPKLPVSTTRQGVTNKGSAYLAMFSNSSYSPTESRCFEHNVIHFCSDYDLNTVCKDICIEETLKCITTCDFTDSECIYGCMRAEITCLESKFCMVIWSAWSSKETTTIGKMHPTLPISTHIQRNTDIKEFLHRIIIYSIFHVGYISKFL